MLNDFARRSTIALGLTATLAAALVTACNSSSDGGDAPGSEKSPPPPPLSLTFPSTVVPAGVEKTECVVLRLGNPAPVHLGSIHNTLGDGSHHLIVYRVGDTEEKPTPFACEPFTDTLDATKGSPLMVTQKKDDRLDLPSGVAYSIEANQMIRLEIHYVNPSTQEKQISATTTMIPISEEDFRDEADFLFIGNPDIRIAPHSTETLGPTFFRLPSEFTGAKFFAMTGHQHKLGTNVQVAVASNATDPGKMVYDVPGWQWSEPKTEVFSTPLTVPDSGGFKFTCTWNNTTGESVGFGESANDEMCFFWAYYYPSQGAKVCIHTAQVSGGNGGDMCCPDHPLCKVAVDELSGR